MSEHELGIRSTSAESQDRTDNRGRDDHGGWTVAIQGARSRQHPPSSSESHSLARQTPLDRSSQRLPHDVGPRSSTTKNRRSSAIKPYKWTRGDIDHMENLREDYGRSVVSKNMSQNNRSADFKTTFCSFERRRPGSCTRDICFFAHSTTEQLYFRSQKLCPNDLEGNCKNERCMYRHRGEKSPQEQVVASSNPEHESTRREASAPSRNTHRTELSGTKPSGEQLQDTRDIPELGNSQGSLRNARPLEPGLTTQADRLSSLKPGKSPSFSDLKRPRSSSTDYISHDDSSKLPHKKRRYPPPDQTRTSQRDEQGSIVEHENGQSSQVLTPLPSLATADNGPSRPLVHQANCEISGHSRSNDCDDRQQGYPLPLGSWDRKTSSNPPSKTCEVCSVNCGSESNYMMHCLGKKHKRRLAQAQYDSRNTVIAAGMENSVRDLRLRTGGGSVADIGIRAHISTTSAPPADRSKLTSAVLVSGSVQLQHASSSPTSKESSRSDLRTRIRHRNSNFRDVSSNERLNNLRSDIGASTVDSLPALRKPSPNPWPSTKLQTSTNEKDSRLSAELVTSPVVKDADGLPEGFNQFMSMESWKQYERLFLSKGGTQGLAFKIVRDFLLSPTVGAMSQDIETLNLILSRVPVASETSERGWKYERSDMPLCTLFAGGKQGVRSQWECDVLRRSSVSLLSFLDPYHYHKTIFDEDSMLNVAENPATAADKALDMDLSKLSTRASLGTVRGSSSALFKRVVCVGDGSRSSEISEDLGQVESISLDSKSILRDAVFLSLRPEGVRLAVDAAVRARHLLQTQETACTEVSARVEFQSAVTGRTE